MRVLDLFSGLRGWSDPWLARGHEVITLDNDPSFGSDLTMDIRVFRDRIEDDGRGPLPWKPDVILASPPCEAFSVMTIGRNWTMEHEPKTDKARLALELVNATLDVITIIGPKFWVIENPRAKLRRLMPDTLDRVTVTYCQYGEPFMKPTDLWGGFPPSWWPRPACRPKAPCHISAARGSRTGIQGGERARLTHPVLIAQSNNGFREDERERRQAFDALVKERAPNARIQAFQRGGGPITEEDDRLLRSMGYDPGGKSNSSFGPIGHLQATAWSGSEARKMASAIRSKIPAQLSEEICIAAERDITS